MLFNVALFTGLFLTAEVLAVPSRLGAHLARRREGRQSHPNQFLQSDASVGSNIVYEDNWAGAAWAEANVCNLFLVCESTWSHPTLV